MNVHIITLFPQMFPGSLGYSLIGKAIAKGLVKLHVHDLKTLAKRVDDAPIGGGAGMLIKAEVVDRAIIEFKLENTYKIFTSPRGFRFNQALAKVWSGLNQDIVILCGRYEGVDQRVLDKWKFNEISMGDFVLCGGEVAAMAMMEATIRLIEGVLGNDESAIFDSHSEIGYLEHNQYTQPAVWQGRSVPDVLLTGNHKKIQAYRNVNSLLIAKGLDETVESEVLYVLDLEGKV